MIDMSQERPVRDHHPHTETPLNQRFRWAAGPATTMRHLELIKPRALRALFCAAALLNPTLVLAASPSPLAPSEVPGPTYSLGSVLDLALTHNPVVASAEGTIEQNRGNDVAAHTYLNPSVSANTGRGVMRDLGAFDAAVRERVTEFNLSIGQPIEWPSKRLANQRATAAGVASASAGLAETRLNLVADVKVAFYDLLLAERALALARQNLSTVEDVDKAVRTRVRLGESPQFEAIRSGVEVLKANQSVTRAANRVRVNRVMLDTLTAGSLGPSYAIEGQLHRAGPGFGIDILTERATTQHPTILRLTKFIELTTHRLEFERQARVPNVTIGGHYWREIGREAFTGGVSFPTPVWDRRQGEIMSAFGNKRKGEAEFLRARNELIRSVSQHFQDAKTTADMIEVYEKGMLKQAEEALRIAKFSFQQGASSLIEVLDAQRVQRQILLDYAQAQFDLSVSLALLERAVGGAI
ncbi:MAG: putative Heavy metal efflux system, outer rane lipoprotein [Nitrospira sp.]|nr:putative Heavy metal efflux system, outer rane lipoprotein [Nitrospira sp.]